MARPLKIVSPGQLEFARMAMRFTPRQMRSNLLDLQLELLCILRPGKPHTLTEIADFVGVSEATLHLIEKSALAKLRAELKKRGIENEFYRFLKTP